MIPSRAQLTALGSPQPVFPASSAVASVACGSRPPCSFSATLTRLPEPVRLDQVSPGFPVTRHRPTSQLHREAPCILASCFELIHESMPPASRRGCSPEPSVLFLALLLAFPCPSCKPSVFLLKSAILFQFHIPTHLCVFPLKVFS